MLDCKYSNQIILYSSITVLDYLSANFLKMKKISISFVPFFIPDLYNQQHKDLEQRKIIKVKFMT